MPKGSAYSFNAPINKIIPVFIPLAQIFYSFARQIPIISVYEENMGKSGYVHDMKPHVKIIKNHKNYSQEGFSKTLDYVERQDSYKLEKQMALKNKLIKAGIHEKERSL
jgi:hypothetical protein